MTISVWRGGDEKFSLSKKFRLYNVLRDLYVVFFPWLALYELFSLSCCAGFFFGSFHPFVTFGNMFVTHRSKLHNMKSVWLTFCRFVFLCLSLWILLHIPANLQYRNTSQSIHIQQDQVACFAASLHPVLNWIVFLISITNG